MVIEAVADNLPSDDAARARSRTAPEDFAGYSPVGLRLARRWAFGGGWSMRRRRGLVFAVVAATVLAVGMLAGAMPAGGATNRPVAGSWVGQVEGSDAYVVVVVGKKGQRRPAGVYLCDGADQAIWFFGSTTNRTLDLDGDGGATVAARVTKSRVTGTVTLADGTSLDFRAKPAKRPAGIYRAVAADGADLYEGGWIVLPDGTQRGAVLNRTTGTVASNVNLQVANPNVTTAGANLKVQIVKPWTNPDPEPWTDPDPEPLRNS